MQQAESPVFATATIEADIRDIRNKNDKINSTYETTDVRTKNYNRGIALELSVRGCWELNVFYMRETSPLILTQLQFTKRSPLSYQ